MKNPDITELKNRLTQMGHIWSVLGLMNWDQSVYLPERGAEARAGATAELTGIAHTKLLALDSDGLLTKLKKQLDAKKIKSTSKDGVIIAETFRIYDRGRKLPDAFVRESAELTSRAHEVWVEARKTNNFKLFLPWLAKIVAMKRQEAKYVGYVDSPYDALLDVYEPGMTVVETTQVLNDLKDFLIPFLKKIQSSKIKVSNKKILGKFPIDEQKKFNEMIVTAMGFDLASGRIDQAVHPFATGLHPTDVRITTRYNEHDLTDSLGGIMHEAGHGLYEQGLSPDYFGTPLAEAISLGIHESQSRLWENIIGKSKSFWTYFYPKLQKTFPKPFKTLDRAEFYSSINAVNPSLIRVEADEVTYNLHVIMRFEIEREMIEGTIDLKDLPKIWNAKVKEYLGIDVPSDTVGVLQDVHWSAGLMGYFPTYALGNLYSAQFYAQLKKDLPDTDADMKKGKLTNIHEWLRAHIHMHGKAHTAGSLVKKVTGEDLNSQYFIDYLEKKYGEIYKL